MSIFFIFIALLFFGFFLLHKFFLSRFKVPKTGSVVFVDGGVKSGKSFFSVYLALRSYRRVHFLWRIVHFFRRDIEEPFLYSNIPLRVPYVPLTREVILRQQRLRFKSVVFIDEASLLADSQLIKDQDINLQILKFVKLFGHETHGGMLIFNSHTPDDLHYGFKRGLSQFFYVHHLTKWIPFFVICHLRECVYSSDGSIVNNVSEDIEKSLQRVIVSKRYFKKYDSYAFSVDTDDLPVSQRLTFPKSLKARNLLSFRTELNKLFNKE